MCEQSPFVKEALKSIVHWQSLNWAEAELCDSGKLIAMNKDLYLKVVLALFGKACPKQIGNPLQEWSLSALLEHHGLFPQVYHHSRPDRDLHDARMDQLWTNFQCAPLLDFEIGSIYVHDTVQMTSNQWIVNIPHPVAVTFSVCESPVTGGTCLCKMKLGHVFPYVDVFKVCLDHLATFSRLNISGQGVSSQVLEPLEVIQFRCAFALTVYRSFRESVQRMHDLADLCVNSVDQQLRTIGTQLSSPQLDSHLVLSMVFTSLVRSEQFVRMNGSRVSLQARIQDFFKIHGFLGNEVQWPDSMHTDSYINEDQIQVDWNVLPLNEKTLLAHCYILPANGSLDNLTEYLSDGFREIIFDRISNQADMHGAAHLSAKIICLKVLWLTIMRNIVDRISAMPSPVGLSRFNR